jgi:hypothetical protein
MFQPEQQTMGKAQQSNNASEFTIIKILEKIVSFCVYRL